MKRVNSFDEIHISDFTFFITPLAAIFSKSSQTELTLVLQKGMQTLGTITQTIPHMKKDSKFQFQCKEHPLQFRISSDKNLHYQWTVYRRVQGEQLEEVDSSGFSLLKFWKEFSAEYQHHTSEFSSALKSIEKEEDRHIRIWKPIISDRSLNRMKQSVLIKKALGFRLEFEILVKSQLDFELERFEIEEEVRLKKLHERQERIQMRKSMINMNQENSQQGKVEMQGNLRRVATELKVNEQQLVTQSNRGVKLDVVPQHEEKEKATFLGSLIQSENKKKQSKTTEKHSSSNGLGTGTIRKNSSFQEGLALSSKLMNINPQSAKQAAAIKKSLREENSQKQFHNSVNNTIIYVIVVALLIPLMYILMNPSSKV